MLLDEYVFDEHTFTACSIFFLVGYWSALRLTDRALAQAFLAESGLTNEEMRSVLDFIKQKGGRYVESNKIPNSEAFN